MSILTTLSRIVLGDPVEKGIKPYRPLVNAVNALEPEISVLSDADLQAKTPYFKEKLSQGATLDDLMPEVFAVVREASKRVLNMRHFDVQLIGGAVLHSGSIAEMRTGEGKTLVSTLPAYLNALTGQGVYMVTVNDYLAKRDREWMGVLFEFLGLTVGLIQADMPPEQRREAYAADITYGTNNEFGFDYLRDHLASHKDDCCQNRRFYAIVDEVDSILIDEARTPLIISGPVQDSPAKYQQVAKLVRVLKPDEHFTADEKHKNIVLTEEGTTALEKALNIDNMYSVENMEEAHIAVQCLKAIHLFKRDADYMVKDGEVIIVDEFTGRLMEGRRYSDGLHQAIEAIEGLKIREESQTLASITFQNYFRMFPKLAGMTGTAKTEETEFVKIYGLSVVAVPTNKPVVRADQADLVYKSKAEKYRAIVNEIKASHEKGQPVLLGTITINTSEHLSKLLKQAGVPHNVLNAKYHEKEAEIIAGAGQKKAVTIATNMAGRGTDIVLGDGVKEIGGLYVIGSERHESRRIDNQLRGRSGRQGDPGKTRFYVCLEDDLMRLFGSDRIASIMERLGLPDDTPIENGMVTKSIERAQKKVEQYHFGIRKQILEYDDVLNKQRQSIYTLRDQLLDGEGLQERIESIIEEVVSQAVTACVGEEKPPYPDDVLTAIEEQLTPIFPLGNMKELMKQDEKQLEGNLTQAFKQLFAFKCNQVDPALFHEIVVRQVMLMTLDRKWIDHLHNMEQLREGIGLRAWGNRDPLVEYKMEAFDMYTEMMTSIYEEALSMINRAVITTEEGDVIERTPKPIKHSAQPKPAPAQSDEIGRNDPCPCGSGKKYKKCCMT